MSDDWHLFNPGRGVESDSILDLQFESGSITLTVEPLVHIDPVGSHVVDGYRVVVDITSNLGAELTREAAQRLAVEQVEVVLNRARERLKKYRSD